MGKKKHKGHHKHDRHEREAFVVPPQVAGIAAAAIEQVNSPAFRQMMAGALGAAAQAFDQRRTGRPDVPPPPVPPVSPIPPEPPRATYRQEFEGPPFQLPPQAALAIERAAGEAGKAIESAAALAARALETASEAMARWAERQASGHERPAPPPPHD